MHPSVPPLKKPSLHPSFQALTYEDEHADQQGDERPGAEGGAHHVGRGVARLDRSLCVGKGGAVSISTVASARLALRQGWEHNRNVQIAEAAFNTTSGENP